MAQKVSPVTQTKKSVNGTGGTFCTIERLNVNIHISSKAPEFNSNRNLQFQDAHNRPAVITLRLNITFMLVIFQTGSTGNG